MEDFKKIELVDDRYNAMYIATNVYAELALLFKEGIIEEFEEGWYIFDLFIRNSNSSNRFVEGYFDGKSFDRNSWKEVKVEKKSIYRKLTCDFFRENDSKLEYSILNSVQKKMIRKGLTI